MAPSPKPSFIFVPGSWCPGRYYEKVIAILQSAGYEAIALDLLSVGKKDYVPTGYNDAAHVRAKATEVLDQGKDVILVANSYGGWVVQEASKGLAREDRASGGAVVHLVLLDTLLVPEGATFSSLVAQYVPMPITDPNIEWIEPMPGEHAGSFLFGTMPEEEQLHYGKMAAAQSAKALTDPLTYAAWQHIPTTSVIGEDDLALPPGVQHENVDKAIADGKATKLKKIVIKGGAHCPMLSHPDEVVQICLDAAEQK
jgi:pimeloyl-ACP methyl ester carboxylesterase